MRAQALGIVPILVFWKKGHRYFNRRPLELPDEFTGSLSTILADGDIEEGPRNDQLR